VSNIEMNDKEKVKAIVDKYDQSISDLVKKGSPEEITFVFKYIADRANFLQRKAVGLED
jgi:hypothetical protein